MPSSLPANDHRVAMQSSTCYHRWGRPIFKILSANDHRVFWVRSCHFIYSDSVYHRTDASSIALEILRAKFDFGASLQFGRRPTVLPYPEGRRLEANHIHFRGRTLHQPTDVGLAMGNGHRMAMQSTRHHFRRRSIFLKILHCMNLSKSRMAMQSRPGYAERQYAPSLVSTRVSVLGVGPTPSPLTCFQSTGALAHESFSCCMHGAR